MTLEIWKICVIVIYILLSIYSYIRAKNGRTEKQVTQTEKKYNRPLTEGDIDEFKKSKKYNIFIYSMIAIALIASMFP